jgi:large subunit ribosomal protein L24
MIVCPHCDQVTRVKHATLSTGKSARVCGRCREQLEVTA